MDMQPARPGRKSGNSAMPQDMPAAKCGRPPPPSSAARRLAGRPYPPWGRLWLDGTYIWPRIERDEVHF